MKRFISILTLVLTFSTTSYANTSPSDASVLIPVASGVVVLGSMSAISASAVVTVKSVEVVADGVVVVLNGASDLASATVKLSSQAAKDLSVAVGKTIEVMSVSTGYILVASGKTLAYIPNEIGNSLLHQSKVQ